MDRRTALDVFGLGELADLGLANTLDLDVVEERCRQLVERTCSETGGSDYLVRQVVQAYLVLKKTNELTSTTELDRRDRGSRPIIVEVKTTRKSEIERGADEENRTAKKKLVTRQRTPGTPEQRETGRDRPQSSKDTWPESWKRATRGFRPYPQ